MASPAELFIGLIIEIGDIRRFFKVKLVYSLADIQQTSDGRVASIQQKISTPIPGSASRGSQSGSSDVRLDIDSGKLISSSGTGRSVIMAVVNVPASPGANEQNTKPAVSTLTLDTKYSVDRLPSASR
jgi:hypothetical protein